MSDNDTIKVEITKTRDVRPYTELWHAANVLESQGIDEPKGSTWKFLSSLVLTVELHQKLTQVLHLKVTHLEEPEYGSIGFCFSSFDLLGFFRRAVFKPIAVVAGFDDVAVMSQAVE